MEENPKYLNMIFPSRLRSLIEEKGVSQKELADFIGVKRQTIAKWRDGITAPDMYSIRELAEYFDVSLEYLYGDSKSKIKENLLISENLGLSDKAIDTIMKLNASFTVKPILWNSEKNRKAVLSAIFEDDEKIRDMIGYLETAIMCYCKDRDHPQIAFYLYETVNCFRKIVESLPEQFNIEAQRLLNTEFVHLGTFEFEGE